jgi:hypothetical protein
MMPLTNWTLESKRFPGEAPEVALVCNATMNYRLGLR